MENPINPVKTVAGLKVYQALIIALLFGAVCLAIGYVINQFVVVPNIVTASTGEQFIKYSVYKPLKKEDATKAADKVVARGVKK